jgi:outer membrane protein with beta-barrel domain
MKKMILLMAVTIMIATNSKAQEQPVKTVDSRNNPHIGIKAGANYSNVYDTQGQDFVANGKFGFAGGGYFAIPLGKYFGIQPEVLFSQKGFQGTGTILGGPYNLTRTTDYIDVPLLFAFKPSLFLTILAGPQYSYLLSQNDEYANGSTTTTQQQEFKNDNIRRNTLCFTGGMDIDLEPVILSARAGWDIQNNNGDGSSTTPRYKNVWYQLTAGFSLF